MKDNIIVKDISQIDLEHTFFHYTAEQNLDTILQNGLEPRIGENALYVEKTRKYFLWKGKKELLRLWTFGYDG